MFSSSFAAKLTPRETIAIFLTGVLLSIVVGLLGLSGFPPIPRLDNALLDALVRSTASNEPARDTVVIDIDDVSLSAVGQWPWPRYRIAALIEQVAAAKPKAIALDILFPEGDRSSLLNIQQTFKRDFGVDVAFSGVPGGLLDNDGFLGETIAHNDVVAALYFYFDHATGAESPGRQALSFGGQTALLNPDTAPGILVNADPIASRTRASGFVNTKLDDDGVLRKVPLLIRHGDALYPHLALAAAMRALEVSSASVESGRNGLAVRVGSHRIPVDASGFATPRFNGRPALHQAISAVDILSGRFRESDLRGRVVFIGTTAVGLNDFHTTAVDPRFPGLKVQSVLTENILHDRFVTTPSWAAPSVFMACVLVGTLVSLLFLGTGGIWPIVGGSVLATAALLSVSAVLYRFANLFVSAAAPALVVAVLFVLFLGVRFAIEKRRARAWFRQLANARQVTIESMAAVAETRDPETGAHIKRTQNYVRAVAQELRRSGQHPDVLTPEYIDLLFLSAPLHDIGKVGVPDHILLKPGRLTPEEMDQMKRHAEFGRQIVFNTAERIDGDNFLVIASEIAGTHHEKWDGTGYPLGLSGETIPLAGRIMAVADVYDALISRRCYKEPFSHAVATTLMREQRGTSFDPAVLDAFFRIEDEIEAIAARFRDDAEAQVEAPLHAPGTAAPATLSQTPAATAAGVGARRPATAEAAL